MKDLDFMQVQLKQHFGLLPTTASSSSSRPAGAAAASPPSSVTRHRGPKSPKGPPQSIPSSPPQLLPSPSSQSSSSLPSPPSSPPSGEVVLSDHPPVVSPASRPGFYPELSHGIPPSRHSAHHHPQRDDSSALPSLHHPSPGMSLRVSERRFDSESEK